MITLAPADDPVYKSGDMTFENLDDAPEDHRQMLRTLVGKQLQGEITPALTEGGLTLHSPATLRERGIGINNVTW